MKSKIPLLINLLLIGSILINIFLSESARIFDWLTLVKNVLTKLNDVIKSIK